LKMTASPIRMSATPLDSAKPPPLLGEHQQEVLRR
jgi:crotonobetainyl-CoA:carnitine CoA-transferase CaiB-like acyl-CoA transferase